ncbi:aldo/keto reductase [Candidatus Marsarchaeota archaeon]|nr:aldo/keto reductase [Candidatus Marsarchaeota archaeon]
MDYKRLGHTDERVPDIGIGTWKIPNDSKAAIDVIQYGIDNGATLVDTAEMYANEELIGKAIRGKDVFIATKVSPNHFRHDDVIKACNASIKRLGVKSIDLYQLHWPNHNVPIKETMSAMEALMNDGKIRHIGVSNFSISEMLDAQDALKSAEIASNQVEYSIFSREIEQEVLPFCQRSHISVIAYSPLARGKLSQEGSGAVFDTLENIAAKHSKSVAQIALNYLISEDNVIAIPKASSIEHMKDNINASGWKLSKADREEISNTSGERPSPLAGPTLQKLLKNTSFWAALMEKAEKRRKEKRQK